MAREDRATIDHADWSGECSLWDMAVSYYQGNVWSRSRHEFEFTNHMAGTEQWKIEYKHVLYRWNGHGWEEVGYDTKPNVRQQPREQNTFDVAHNQTYTPDDVVRVKNWANTRSCIVTDGWSSGDRFKLDAYTLVDPVDAGGNAIKAFKVREFTVEIG